MVLLKQKSSRNYKTPETALVVEPDLMRRMALRGILQKAGIRKVWECQDVQEALTLLGAELVDIVLTEWEVPGMAGPDLIKALQNRGQNRNLPVVLVDDNLPQQDVVTAVKAGIKGRLSLPGDAEQMTAILENLIEADASQHRE